MNKRYTLIKILKGLTAFILAVSFITSTEPLSVLAYPVNDTYLDAQWGINNTGSYTYYIGGTSYQETSKEGVDINLFEGWDAYRARNDSEVIVAIIDTGVCYEHPDLVEHMWINPGEIPDNGIDDDGNGYIDDVYGWDFYNNDNTVFHSETYTDPSGTVGEDDHGTHIAGIIAATADNGVGVTGVASNVNVKIMSLKINGGKNAEGTAENAIKAIKYAEEMGAKVVNLSWGSYSPDEDLRIAIEESKMLFVCAAGNNGVDTDVKPMYPASFDCDNIISVTYINPMGKLVSSTSGYFATLKGSNYGLKSVDIAAPGTDILSTVPNGYAYKSGSSMAAPFVTGMAAIAFAYNPDFYATQVKDAILSTAKYYADMDQKMTSPGIPDLKGMIEKLPDLRKDREKPHIKTLEEMNGSKLYVTVQATDPDGSGIALVKYEEGYKNADFFKEGGGTVIHNNTPVQVEKGVYSFYVVDKCGNDSISCTTIGEDDDAPDISAKVYGRGQYEAFGIDLFVKDSRSTVTVLKYLIGAAAADEVKKKGSDIPISGEEIKIATDIKNKAISFYTEDSFGNSAFLVVDLKIKYSAGMILSATERRMDVGETYVLGAFLLPADTTDTLTYTSSNPKVAEVAPDGTITALSKGECEITVSSQSGVTGRTIIKVN